MTGAIGLVTDVVFGVATALVCAAIIALAFGVLWYAMPLRRRVQDRRR